MLKLHQHFTTNLAIVFLIALILSSVVSYFSLRDITLHKLENDLKADINLIKLQMPFSDHKDTLETFVKAIDKGTGNRVTIVNHDGIVIAESRFDIQEMENHGFRPEILDAKEMNFGINLRYSHTLDKDFLYVAHQFDYQGEPIFLRLAIDTTQITKNFITLWYKIAIIFALALIFSFLVSLWINTKVHKEIEKLSGGLRAIAEKDYRTHIKAAFAKEFVAIADTVHTLAAKLAKRDKQKRKYTAKLRLINKQRSDIISAISHEFKNPTAAIIGYAQTLQEEGDADEMIRQRFLGKIISNGEKITQMINRLSLATKLENGDLQARKTSFDLASLVEDVITQFKTRFPHRQFEAHLSSSPITADSAIIEMVLNNLIDNALKYSEESITITVKDGCCSIQDQGEGIPEEELHQVTKKFYRSNRLTWDNSIGLGLSLVTYMLKLHESDLMIESHVGVGSTFSFKLT